MRRPERLPTSSSVSVGIYWLFLLAFIPLGFWLLQEDQEHVLQRLAHAIATAPVQARIQRILESEDGSLGDVIKALPEGRLEGSFLPRDTMMHWLFAFAAAGCFLLMILLLFPTGNAQAGHMLLVGLFTATAGIFFLFLVQKIAGWTEGRWLVGRGIVTLLFYIAKFIGYSYNAALLVALASFGWLVLQLERSRGTAPRAGALPTPSLGTW